MLLISKPDWYYKLVNFFSNLRIFLPMAWKWRRWDSRFSIHAFADMLEAQARSVKENDRFIGSERVYKRAMSAAGYLRKAYEDKLDNTVLYLHEKNKTHFHKFPNSEFSQMSVNYLTDERIYDRMIRLAYAREEKVHSELKQHAWAYVSKYIEHIWD